MPDIPGDTSTTSTITVGSTVADSLEIAGDHDWFRIELTAGQIIEISLDGISLYDSTVGVRNASGDLLAFNDDYYWYDYDSFLGFEAPSTGTYYIDVGGYADSHAGTYELEVGPTNDVRNDFNGDSRSDILWRNSDGSIGNWLANASGGHAANNASIASVPNYWQIAGTGDFNGDGRDDILWRGDGGEVGNWTANSSGVFAYNAAAGITVVANSWQIAGVGDFNGDHRDDILWRNSDGTIGNWLANPGGVFAYNAAAGITGVSNYWQIAGIGDFNGDGRDDILWRGDGGEVGNWLGNTDGSFNYNAAAGVTAAPTSWQIVGTGDFNGDNRDDILWRNSDGTIGNWLANPSAGFAANDASLNGVPNYWQIASIGDFNFDGRDDILWRGDGGEVGNWTASPSGVFAYNAAAGIAVVPNSWQVEPEQTLV